MTPLLPVLSVISAAVAPSGACHDLCVALGDACAAELDDFDCDDVVQGVVSERRMSVGRRAQAVREAATHAVTLASVEPAVDALAGLQGTVADAKPVALAEPCRQSGVASSLASTRDGAALLVGGCVNPLGLAARTAAGYARGARAMDFSVVAPIDLSELESGREPIKGFGLRTRLNAGSVWTQALAEARDAVSDALADLGDAPEVRADAIGHLLEESEYNARCARALMDARDADAARFCGPDFEAPALDSDVAVRLAEVDRLQDERKAAEDLFGLGLELSLDVGDVALLGERDFDDAEVGADVAAGLRIAPWGSLRFAVRGRAGARLLVDVDTGTQSVALTTGVAGEMGIVTGGQEVTLTLGWEGRADQAVLEALWQDEVNQPARSVLKLGAMVPLAGGGSVGLVGALPVGASPTGPTVALVGDWAGLEAVGAGVLGALSSGVGD